MKSLKAAVALIAVFVAVGCGGVSGGNGAVSGGLYAGYKMGGNIGPGQGTKTGEACAMQILGLIGLGDASISTAKAAGGITQVAHVDHDIFNVLGIFGKSCTVVVGQ
jgi:hypothetical protein